MGYTGALPIHNSGVNLSNIIGAASTACCVNTNAVITGAEATAVLNVVQDVTPDIEDTLASVVTKKPEFDAVFLVTGIVKDDIISLDAATDGLITCLISRTPTSHMPDATIEKDLIDTAFNTTKTAYGIPL